MHPDISPERPRTETFKILFVCTGNTCRSPMAQAVARSELERRGWEHVQVASAGVAADSGANASTEAVNVVERYGMNLRSHRSQTLTTDLLDWADLVLVMSPSHLARVQRMGYGDKASLLGDFAAGGDGLGGGVSDPFGADEAVYEKTLRELQGLISAALERLAPILHP